MGGPPPGERMKMRLAPASRPRLPDSGRRNRIGAAGVSPGLFSRVSRLNPHRPCSKKRAGVRRDMERAGVSLESRGSRAGARPHHIIAAGGAGSSARPAFDSGTHTMITARIAIIAKPNK